jgi:hypothetical protein
MEKLELSGKDAAKFKRSVSRTVPTCIDCNNTWMSTLENDVKDVFLAMFEQTRMLDCGEQELLAKWAVMKAILMDAAQEEPVLPRGFGHDLNITRRPHEAVGVWIAAYGDKEILPVELRPIYAPPGKELPHNDPMGWCATFAIVRIAFQVFIPLVRLGGDHSRLENFKRSVVQIWPPGSEMIDWPPPYFFDKDSFKALARRIHDNREPTVMQVTLKKANRLRGRAT